jgi:hypothetical protein
MGRMGNQMFQYACAKNLELKYGFICSLDDLSKLKYFELQSNEKIKNTIKQKFFFHFIKRVKGIKSYNLNFQDMLQDYSQWLHRLDEPTVIWGFFQSEKYFKESAEEIKFFFKIKYEYRTNFLSFLERNNLTIGKYNALHIRRTDYKGFTVKSLKGDDFILPMSYYKQVLNNFPQNETLLIVSDDPDYCRLNFGNIPNIKISLEDEITDFQILSNAKLIAISNSTYAWWAAWLSPYAKSVFCPKYFLGFKDLQEVPINIYPVNWKQINIPID